MSNLIDIEELQRRIGEKEKLLVCCTALWNTRLDGQLEALLAKAGIIDKQVQVVRLNTDDPNAWPHLQEWGVLNLPALVFFRGGACMETINGLRALPELERLTASWYSYGDLI